MYRGERRNLARVMYRTMRRPGIYNPMAKEDLPVRPGNPKSRRTRSDHKPMRHVYKLHVPRKPRHRIIMSQIPRLARMHRDLVPATAK